MGADERLPDQVWKLVDPLHFEPKAIYTLSQRTEYADKIHFAELSRMQRVAHLREIVLHTGHPRSNMSGSTSLEGTRHDPPFECLRFMAIATLYPRLEHHQWLYNGLDSFALVPKTRTICYMFQTLRPIMAANSQLLGRIRYGAKNRYHSIFYSQQVTNCVPQCPPPPVCEPTRGLQQRGHHSVSVSFVNVHGANLVREVLPKLTTVQYLKRYLCNLLPL